MRARRAVNTLWLYLVEKCNSPGEVERRGIMKFRGVTLSLPSIYTYTRRATYTLLSHTRARIQTATRRIRAGEPCRTNEFFVRRLATSERAKSVRGMVAAAASRIFIGSVKSLSGLRLRAGRQSPCFVRVHAKARGESEEEERDEKRE